MEWLKESIDLFEKLKSTGKPVVVYGMGNGADKVFELCGKNGIKISGVFASDDFVRGQTFRGHTVKTLAVTEKELADFTVLVAFGSNIPAVMERIYRISLRHETYYPSTPLFGQTVFDLEFVNRHLDKLTQVYGMLEDAVSKKVFSDIVNFNISGKVQYLLDTQERRQAMKELLQPGDQETFVDVGAFKGDTLDDFRSIVKTYKKLIALEPDPKTFEKLKEHCRCWKDVELYAVAAYDADTQIPFGAQAGRNSAMRGGAEPVEARTVDGILNGREATILKFDVEGMERSALKGCARTIASFSPKLVVSAYHRSGDIIALPLLIASIQPKYRFFLRREPCFPMWDIRLYAL